VGNGANRAEVSRFRARGRLRPALAAVKEARRGPDPAFWQQAAGLLLPPAVRSWQPQRYPDNQGWRLRQAVL